MKARAAVYIELPDRLPQNLRPSKLFGGRGRSSLFGIWAKIPLPSITPVSSAVQIISSASLFRSLVRTADNRINCPTLRLVRLGSERITLEDVHAFPGHIACDSASNSEIVIPLLRGAELLGVLDLDSPLHARFGAADARGLEALAKIFIGSLG